MTKRILKIALPTISFLPPLMFWSCSGGDGATLQCGEVEFIDRFPKEIVIEDAKPFLSDFEGAQSVKGLDSLMLTVNYNTPYSFDLYSSKSGEKLASLFKQGQGPDEYPAPLSLNKLWEYNDSIYAIFSERAKKRLITVNLTASASTGNEVVSKQEFPFKFAETLEILPLSTGDTLVAYMGSYDSPADKRMIRTATGESEIPNLGDLQGDWPEVNRNTLAGIFTVLPGDSVVAEAMIELNQIMVYSLKNPDYRRTVCVGDELTEVKKDSFFNRMSQLRTYGGSQVTDRRALFLSQNMKESDYMDNKGVSTIQIFDTSMRPVARVTLPMIIQGFYVDKEGNLYGFNPLGDNEYLYKWDISDLL